jgi:hypothetical protein
MVGNYIHVCTILLDIENLYCQNNHSSRCNSAPAHLRLGPRNADFSHTAAAAAAVSKVAAFICLGAAEKLIAALLFPRSQRMQRFRQ